MVDQESGAAESSRVRREREEESAAVGTPSKKRRQGRKSEVAEGAADGSGKVAAKAGEDGKNGVVEGNAERTPQESGEAGDDGGKPSGDPSAAAAGTVEAASRPEAPGQEVYRIPSYAGA